MQAFLDHPEHPPKIGIGYTVSTPRMPRANMIHLLQWIHGSQFTTNTKHSRYDRRIKIRAD